MIELGDVLRLVIEENARAEPIAPFLAQVGMTEATYGELVARVARAAMQDTDDLGQMLIGAVATGFNFGWQIRDQYGKAS